MSIIAAYAIVAAGLVVPLALPLASFAADPVITPEDPNSAVAGALTGSAAQFGGVIAAVLGTIVGLYVAMLAYKWVRRQLAKGVHAKA